MRIAQDLLDQIKTWGNVVRTYGPMEHRTDQVFMRFVLEDGSSYAIELTQENGE